jgi:hypothetical protein
LHTPPQTTLWLSFLPLLVMTIPLGIICYHLAKNKGLRVVPWIFWGFIPIVNYFILIYLVGAKDKLIDDKLNNIIRILEALKIEVDSKDR